MDLNTLHKLNVKELKQIARDRNYKGFGNLRKEKLVEFIINRESSKESSKETQFSIYSLSVKELKNMAKLKGIKGAYKMKKSQLIELLTTSEPIVEPTSEPIVELLTTSEPIPEPIVSPSSILMSAIPVSKPILEELGLPVINEEKTFSPVIEIIRPIQRKKKKTGRWGKKKEAPRKYSFLPPLSLPTTRTGFHNRERYLNDTIKESGETTLLQILENTSVIDIGDDVKNVLDTIQNLPTEEQYIKTTPNIDDTIEQIINNH